MIAETNRAFLTAFYNLGKYHSKEFEFLVEVYTKREQFRAKNALTTMALKLDCELMWQIDDDTILRGDTFEVLVKALDADPDAGIAGALYNHKGGEFHPVVMWTKMTPIGNTIAGYYQPHELTGDVMEVGVVGGGCMLFRMAPFKGMMEPYFWNEADTGTDVQICQRMSTIGWKVLCHTGHEVGHVGARKIWWPSALDEGVADMNRFNETLYFDILEWLEITPDGYRTLLVKALADFHMRWLAMGPETADEYKSVYEHPELQDVQLARSAFYNARHRRTWADLMAYVRKHNPATGLDYGCGTGMGAQLLAQEGVMTTAMDLELDQLKFLEFRAKRHEFEDKLRVIRIESSDGRDYLPDENFDVIIVKDVLEHLPNPKEILDALLLRLNIGGILFTNAHTTDFKGADEGEPQHLNRISIDEFLDICGQHGVKPWYGQFLRKEE